MHLHDELVQRVNSGDIVGAAQLFLRFYDKPTWVESSDTILRQFGHNSAVSTRWGLHHRLNALLIKYKIFNAMGRYTDRVSFAINLESEFSSFELDWDSLYPIEELRPYLLIITTLILDHILSIIFVQPDHVIAAVLPYIDKAQYSVLHLSKTNQEKLIIVKLTS